MPTVAIEGRLRFMVHTNELPYEPPHVHVYAGGESLCRIELYGGEFMDDPPGGMRRTILEAYRKHAVEIFRVWDRIHGGLE